MKHLFFTIVSFIISLEALFAAGADSVKVKIPDGSIMNDSKDPIGILSLIQSALLKVVLPVIVVWASLYIAYELFTAEGDESKMKKAWKSIAYTAIALIAIALSYAIVSIISGLSF